MFLGLSFIFYIIMVTLVLLVLKIGEYHGRKSIKEKDNESSRGGS